MTETDQPSKKALKLQRREEKYQKNKEKRIQGRKQKKQLMKERKREQNEALIAQGLPPITRSRISTMDPVDINFVIDLDFDDKMNQKEFKSLASQLAHCYSINRRAQPPAKLVFSSFSNQIEERTTEQFHGQHLNWQVNREAKSFHEAFPTEKMIYLTADSPNRLETLEEGHFYIIGGIVDHNRYKNLCLTKAESLGIQHAHLPISEYIQMVSRRVLTVNQVIEIMLKFVEYKDWKRAFLECIPQRKILDNN